jgi:MFS family permease
MKRNTLIQLFAVQFAIFLTGMGLLPLLPVYAQSFGADAAGVGFYLGITYAAITAGTLLANRLAGRFGYRRLFIGAGLLGMPALVALGAATRFEHLVALTAVVWFSGGVGIALVNVFTGLFTEDKSRGRSFTLTFLALPLASIVAGFSVGRLVEWHGYPFMFIMLALTWALWPAIAVLGVGRELPAYRRTETAHGRAIYGGASLGALGRPFAVLLAATLLSATAVYLTRLGTSYTMHGLGFTPGTISSTSAVGGLVTIPLAYAVGALSDRFGRTRFLAGSFVLGGSGALLLAGAGQLWHFWLATALVFVALNAGGSLAPALATDLLPTPLQPRGLPYIGAMRNVAGIIGFTGGGWLLDVAGPVNLSLAAAVVAGLAALLVSRLRVDNNAPASTTVPAADNLSLRTAAR